jgi:serine protease 16
MVELAPKEGALLLALEHRYYGDSNPFPDFSTEHLKWLNTEQALGDIAAFHEFVRQLLHLSADSRWVAFGGSYPGILAGLARLRYPHLIYAAVASSAPLDATVDLPGYNDVVGQSVADPVVGGSPACLAALARGRTRRHWCAAGDPSGPGVAGAAV